MKTLEQGKTRVGTWLGNATALPVFVVHSLVAIQFLFQTPENENSPGENQWHLGRVRFGDTEVKSLFYNAVVFVRMLFPFGIFVQLRWSGSDVTKKEYVQFGLGWKLNGRLGALFRIQSDKASAAGVSGPNSGQATGFMDGTK